MHCTTVSGKKSRVNGGSGDGSAPIDGRERAVSATANPPSNPSRGLSQHSSLSAASVDNQLSSESCGAVDDVANPEEGV